MRRYLVVANQTLGGDALVELLANRAKAEQSEFVLVVPATPTVDFVEGMVAIPMMGGVPCVPDTPEHAQQLAQERLDVALAQLAAVGVPAEGRVGHADPVHAVDTVLKGRQFDEIIVSTLPSRFSRWLRQDLPSRLGRRSGLPVTHVVASE